MDIIVIIITFCYYYMHYVPSFISAFIVETSPPSSSFRFFKGSKSFLSMSLTVVSRNIILLSSAAIT